MLLADVVIWIGVIFLVGFVGFFVMAAVLLVRLMGHVFRALFGNPDQDRGPAAAGPERQRRVCPEAHCAHVNPSAARFCGRCGRPLRAVYDVDAYG